MRISSEPRNGTRPRRPFVATMFHYSLGGELAAMRLRAGIPPESMARKVDLTPDELDMIEAGLAPILTDLLVRWCAVVDADPGQTLNRAAHYTPPPMELRVDLALLMQGLNPETGGWVKQLAAWTDASLGVLPGNTKPVVTLRDDDLERLAGDLHVPVADLVMTLGDFTPLEPTEHPY